MTEPLGTVIIDRSHCGPPESGNGGWVAGTLAEFVATDATRPAVTVRLSAPPPLERPLDVQRVGGSTLLFNGSHQIASAAAAPAPDFDLPVAVTVAEAIEAEANYEGDVDHPFPTCFSCGPDRSTEDALGLRPSALSDQTGRYAARWTPFAASVPLVWAALDCPGAWSAGVLGRPMVLGSMTAQVLGLPEVGVEHVVTAWLVRAEGRKHFTGTMLHSPDGELLAVASAIWITVEAETFRPIDHHPQRETR